MSWLSKALAKLKKKKSNENVGDTKADCPLKETCLLVVVMRGANGEPVEGASVKLKGQTTGAAYEKETDRLKVAHFKPVEPDDYTIEVILPEDIAGDFEPPENERRKVAAGTCPIHFVRTSPLVDLKVEVVPSVLKNEQEANLTGVEVQIQRTDGAGEVLSKKTAGGFALFEKLKTGTYRVSVTDLANFKQSHYTTGDREVSVRDMGGAANKAKIPVNPFGTLQVKVLRDNDGKALGNIRVALVEKNLTRTTAVETGLAPPFEGLLPETYTVKLELDAEQSKTYAAPEPLKVAVKTGEDKKVDIELSMHRLKIVLVDGKLKPLSKKNWRLSSPVEAEGATGGDGLIEIKELTSGAKAGKLKVDMKKTAPEKKKKEESEAVADDGKKYPPPIDPKQFKDPEPPAKISEDDSYEWDLTIGLLESLDAEARLHNLGFECAGDARKAAVKTYQKLHMKQPDGSGNLPDIENHLRDKHDNL